MDPELTCPECGKKMMLRRGKFGWFYGCLAWPKCLCTHGAHQQSKLPLGTPCDTETRRARIQAHRSIDVLWKGRNGDGKGIMSRDQVYAYLARKMGIRRGKCHIGDFDLEQCREAARIAEVYAHAIDVLEGEHRNELEEVPW